MQPVTLMDKKKLRSKLIWNKKQEDKKTELLSSTRNKDQSNN